NGTLTQLALLALRHFRSFASLAPDSCRIFWTACHEYHKGDPSGNSDPVQSCDKRLRLLHDEETVQGQLQIYVSQYNRMGIQNPTKFQPSYDFTFHLKLSSIITWL